MNGFVKSRSVAVVVFADREQSFEVVAGFVKAKGREQPRGTTVAVQERVNVHQLKLRNAAYQHRVYFQIGVEPFHEVGHHDRYVDGGRRGVDHFAGGRIGDVVLHAPIFAWGGAAAAHTFDELFVNLANESFADRVAAFDAFRDELERVSIIEQLPRVVRVGIGDGLAFPKSLGLVQGQVGSLYVGGVSGPL